MAVVDNDRQRKEEFSEIKSSAKAPNLTRSSTCTAVKRDRTAREEQAAASAKERAMAAAAAAQLHATEKQAKDSLLQTERKEMQARLEKERAAQVSQPH